MLKRVLSALIAVPISLFFIYLGGLPFTIVVGALTFLGIKEFNAMLEKDCIKPVKLLSYFTAFAIIVVSYLGNDFLLNAMIVFPFILLFIFLILTYHKYKLKDIIYTFFGTVYNAVLFSYLILIRLHTNNGFGMTILLFACVWVNDSAAYFLGSYFGKNKLCPKISPNKTIEGSVGGVLGGLIPAIIGGVIFLKLGLAHSVIIGLISAVLGQLGDLAESIIKRTFKTKDSGRFMPGHGGVLDRFDSILFVVPVLYYYTVIFLT